MLVITRVRSESIVIADKVEITILEIRGDKVRLGITSPMEMPVHRKEVYDALRQAESDPSRAAVASPNAAELSASPVDPPSLSLESAIDLLLRASSARLSPEESAAARLLLEAVRAKLK